MTEEKIDITQQAEDLANEKLAAEKKEQEESKVTGLEAELAEYKKKEEEAKLAEEEAKKSEISKRLELVEEGRKEDKLAFDAKLETLSVRQTNGKVKTDPKEALSREDYDKDPDKYQRLMLQDILKNKGMK